MNFEHTNQQIVDNACDTAKDIFKDSCNHTRDAIEFLRSELIVNFAKLAEVNNKHASDDIVAGALYDFLGYLTTRPTRIVMSDRDEAGQAVDALVEWSKTRSLNLDDARVEDWKLFTAPTSSLLRTEQEHRYELKLPEGESRQIKTWFSERSFDGNTVTHKICISVDSPASKQEPVIDHSCKDNYELIMKWADIYAAQTGEIYAQAAQDPSKAAKMADERTMLACVVAQVLSIAAPKPAAAPVRMDEYDKTEWQDVARQLCPGLTDETYDEMWVEFCQAKHDHYRNLSLH